MPWFNAIAIGIWEADVREGVNGDFMMSDARPADAIRTGLMADVCYLIFDPERRIRKTREACNICCRFYALVQCYRYLNVADE